MKVLLLSSPSSIFRISTLRSVFHSSRTVPTATSPNTNDNLHRRIARAGIQATSIIPLLEQWLDQGKQIKPSELQSIVKMLRSSKRFNHALQILDWMNEQKAYNLSAGDHAVQLDLISRVRGLEAAEKHFESIPVNMRDYHVYGSFLFCYAIKKSEQKAEAIMQKMRDRSYVKGPLCYNVMLKLYAKLGKYDKMNNIFQEMEKERVQPNKFTFNVRLRAFMDLSDVDGMEKFLAKWEADPTVAIGWHSYFTAANGYLKAGLTEKALTLLKRSEQLVDPKSRKVAYEVLMTSYGNAGKKEDVYRLWNLYKKMTRFYNTGYICVISSLLKLDDIEGAEKILEEWETRHVLFDIRVPNLLISGYCRKGMLEKAEDYVNKLIEKGKVLDASTWERLSLGYKTANLMEKAAEKWKKAILVSEPGWRPHSLVLGSCIDYLEGKGDVENVKDVIRLLNERGHLPGDAYDRLVNEIGGGNLSFKIVDAIRGVCGGDALREDNESFNGEDGEEKDFEFEGDN